MTFMCVLTDVLPLDRYIRAVAVCNSLALLASQGTMAQFIQRIAILTQLQKFWNKGYESVSVTCEAAAGNDDAEDDPPCDNETLVAVNTALENEPVLEDNDWETHSNSTVDLKPDIAAMATEPELSEPEVEKKAKGNGTIASCTCVFHSNTRNCCLVKICVVVTCGKIKAPKSHDDMMIFLLDLC